MVDKANKGKLNRTEKTNLVLFTIIYLIVFGVVKGYVYFHPIAPVIVFGVPWDINSSIDVSAFVIWGLLSFLLNYKYQNNNK